MSHTTEVVVGAVLTKHESKRLAKLLKHPKIEKFLEEIDGEESKVENNK